MENEIQNLQNQIDLLKANNWNSTLLDVKDGFFLTVNLTGTAGATAGNYGTFYTARHPVEVLWVAESHTVAGTNAGAVTLDIEKLTGTQALDAGVSILSATFNLKGTANTVVQKEGYSLSVNRQLKQGERLALKDTGTLTDVAGVQVTLYLKFLARGNYK